MKQSVNSLVKSFPSTEAPSRRFRPQQPCLDSIYEFNALVDNAFGWDDDSLL